MAKVTQFAITLIFAYLLFQSLAMAISDEERYMDKMYNTELLNWLVTYQFPQRISNLCKYYNANLNTAPMPKRNSELINSLLSLPKNMNDAGK